VSVREPRPSGAQLADDAQVAERTHERDALVVVPVARPAEAADKGE
jgi:hypothetical protein